MPTDRELMAQASASALIATASADSIEVPDRIERDLMRMAAATGQRIVKISAGMTAEQYHPAGPLPLGVARLDWNLARLTGTLGKRPG